MKHKKEQTEKKARPKFSKLGFKRALLLALMALAAKGLAADPQEGTVTRVQIKNLGFLQRLWVYVDTTGNRIADTILAYPDPNRSSMARNLEIFIERGMPITFDDDGFFVEDGIKQVAGSNTKTIDGIDILELFPDEAARFKFAAQTREAAAAQTQNQH